MKLRKSQDFYGHWIVEEEIEPETQKFGMVMAAFWVPIGEFTSEEQADAVIAEIQKINEFKPQYEFFNIGSNSPEETGRHSSTPFGMLLEGDDDDENTEIH